MSRCVTIPLQGFGPVELFCTAGRSPETEELGGLRNSEKGQALRRCRHTMLATWDLR